MCGGERGFPSKLVVTDGCLKEVAAELGFEGWVESGEKEGVTGAWVCVLKVCVYVQRKVIPTHITCRSEGFTGEGASSAK